MQISKTPQITFGIKHSPLLGQLKPIQPLRPIEKQTTEKITSRDVTQTTQTGVIKEQINNEIVQQSKDVTNEINRYVTNESNVYNERAHVTHLRENGIRSSTVTPEPVHEVLTQEIVWVPDTTPRRGSYTIDRSDGFTEHYQNSEVIPVENGVIRTAAQGERGATVTEENSTAQIRREGYEQNVSKNVKNATAHEKSQAATEEVRTGTQVQQLANGGIAKTTTTTTVRKVGTSAKTANATTTVTRTATAVTSRDIGVK